MISTAPLLVQSPLLAGLRHVRHGFTTRHGGVSQGPLASLNLARRPGEDPAAPVENWARVARALEAEPGELALLSQVHGARVLIAEHASGPLAVLGEGDALVTTRPGLVLAARAADCVPVLLAAPQGVAAVHSGWRGTAQNVVGAAVAALCEVAGAQPSELVAAVGPCISGAAYECGDEVPRALAQAGLSPTDFLRSDAGAPPSTGAGGGTPERAHVDLGRAVLAQLREAGVERRARLEVCTVADPRFYSHRGEGPETGRFAGVIALRR